LAVEAKLAGRAALVTGGLRGIGYASCAALLEEGARVYVADLPPPDDAECIAIMATLGAQARYLRLNVTDEAAWIAALGAVRAETGRLDILVSNAGTDLVGDVETIALADWRRLMSVNVDGVFLGTKHCTSLLETGGRTTPAGSSIINVSSIMGLVGYAGTSAYNTSKGAVRLFTKATAIEFARARRPIRVNSVHPGFVRTPLLTAGMQRWVDAGAAPSAQALIDGLAEQTPNGRVAEPHEIGAVIAFLASDASSYMTGAEIAVDGGWTAQ
jgi:NAD(P)-dependent dehydrogenase (short-subunit alcohol dehydrogenase family)